MSTYCTTTDAYRHNPSRIYNTTSKPKAAQVTSFIVMVSAEIDARLGAVGITVPVTGATALVYLRHLCSMGVACYTEEAAFMGGNANNSEHADWLCKKFEDKMQAIENNPDIIVGITSGVTASFDSYEYSNPDKAREETDEPFIRDDTQW